MAQLEQFFSLSPDKIVDVVESSLPSLGRATGYCLALNSLENRVFEIEFENGSKVVSKFYRPGRWSENQIQEEHRFLQLLTDYEVPVVVPLALASSSYSRLLSSTLGKTEEDIYFTVFPKVQGRIENELNDEHLRILGRYVARIHAAGAAFNSKYRWRLEPKLWIENSLNSLRAGHFLESPMGARYLQTVETLFPVLDQRLSSLFMQAIHGDCHLGNTLWHQGQPFFLDFDDMMVGPPVQDLWMIVRGRDEEALRQRELLLSNYEMMRAFDHSTISQIEALRALRMIHFSGWIAKRWEDPSFPKVFVNFASSEYWQEEIVALEESLNLLRHFF